MNGEVIEIRNQHGYPVHVKVRARPLPEAMQTGAGLTRFFLFTMGLAFFAGCVMTYVVMEIWS